MADKRIQDNASFEKLRKDYQGIRAIGKVVKFFEFFGIKNKEISEAFEKLDTMQNQLKILSESPDKFNDYYANRGWIAHESMNQDIMLTAIEFAEKGHIESGEDLLVNYYSSNKIEFLVGRLRGIDAFQKRYELFYLAYKDTLAERFHASIPVILMMMDGAVNDIDRGKGFFADNTDLTAWDSIAAHSSGLKVLKEILSTSRRKTSEETIFMPYRNGIIHGRDIGYANRTVAAKSWAALFAVNDWARAVKDGKKLPPPEQPVPTLKEQLSSFKESLQQLEQNKVQTKKIEAWKARKIELGIDVPKSGISADFAEYTPEKEAILFAEYWAGKKYGLIAKHIHHFSNKNISDKVEAGKIKRILSNKVLISHELIKIEDCAPAISEVTMIFNITFENKNYFKTFTLRLIYQDTEGSPLVRGEANGQWKFIESFFHQLEYLY